ncbi:MAG TPA: SAM-dependent methyltransferase [Acidimicrobiaceae bacterium]|nr:SAM-dependent methyltransferase [Acidimicrobiaceae bacterium]
MTRSETSSFGTVSRTAHDSTQFYNRRMYDDEPAVEPAGDYNECLPAQVNVVHCADARQMTHLPDESAHLMITSPPYNVGKDYDENLSLDEYAELLADVLAETFRVLVDGGRACVNIANVGRSPYIPLHAHIINSALRCGFNMRGEIIWDKGASAGSSCAWGSWRSASNPVLRDVHEYILIFSKGSFKRRSAGDGTGTNTIERDDFLDATKSVWKFPAASARRANHPAPFPLELPRRLIELYSFAGDVVLDPFLGSGTTAEAAMRTGRDYVGYELDKGYADLARERLAAVHAELAVEPAVEPTVEPAGEPAGRGAA